MLQAVDISLKRGDEVIFDQMSWTVHAGQKVGVVGRNGVGKSTLFELILGTLPTDLGDLTKPPDWHFSHMAQQSETSDRPAIEYVQDGHRELRRVERQLAAAEHQGDSIRQAELYGEYADVGGYEAEARAGEILHGLGFESPDFSRPFVDFSGGQRIRLNLARTLMAPADAMLLDEPTNHLDLDTTVWLERWLKRFQGTLLIIAHDREFLDGVVDHIIHLHDRRADAYRGNYSEFERQRAAALLTQQAAYTKQRAKIEHMEAFVRRFRAKASKARQAQSRLKALERMATIAPVHIDSGYEFAFTNPERMSNPLLGLRGVSLGYDGDAVLTDLNATILPGARIGILGINGAGKSTLLKSLVGELEPIHGEISRGQHCQPGYFAQHQLETLDAHRTPLQHLQDAKPAATEQWCRNYLGGWGFGREIAERTVTTLSGGEKARLVLALIALTGPALLVLDEPTNHLDLEMREALAVALQDYTGALLLVSHDRSLLRSTVDEFWSVAGGKVRVHNGTLDDYADATLLHTPEQTDGSQSSGQGKERRQANARRRANQQPLRKAITQLDAKIERLTRALTDIEARLADPDVYRELEADELQELLAEAGRLRKLREDAEQQWLHAAEALESLQSPVG